MQLRSVITCPQCGFQAEEAMSTETCRYFYPCRGCGVLLRPLPGDCCVFCSYATVPCPPQQAGEAAPLDGGSAAAQEGY